MNARTERTSMPSGRKQKQNIRTIHVYSIHTKLPILLVSNMAESLRNASILLFWFSVFLRQVCGFFGDKNSRKFLEVLDSISQKYKAVN